MYFPTVSMLALVQLMRIDVVKTAPRQRRSLNISEPSSSSATSSIVEESDASPLGHDEQNVVENNMNFSELNFETIKNNENVNKLVELIEERLVAKEEEIAEISEMRGVKYDGSSDTETTIMFPVEVDPKPSSLDGYTFTDHAANEMIERLDGDMKAFEELKTRIHFLEANVGKHKDLHLVDNNPIKDAQTILEVLDKKMLIPFGVNLEAIKELIIKMDHSLKGEALEYVKGLTERAEAFVKEAHEKLEIVVEADEEWTNEEEAFQFKVKDEVLKMEEVVLTSDVDVGRRKEASSEGTEPDETSRNKTISDTAEMPNDEINEASIIEDAASSYKKWGKDQVEEQLYNEDFVTTERVIMESSIENNISNENEEDVGNAIIEGTKTKDDIETPSETAVDKLEIDRKINPKIKLLLEEANFWKINEELTPHKHEQESGSWAVDVGLPLLIVVPLLAILAALFAFTKMKKKEIVSVNSLNSWGNDYSCPEKVSTMENSNYYKLK